MPKSRRVARYAKHQRWSAEDARAVLAALAKSGLSLAAFARDTGISEQRLYFWRNRLEAGADAAPPPFVEVRHGGTEVVEIALRSGRSVRVPAAIDGAVLRRLIDALEQDSTC
jgi:transposase-like protein